MAVGVSIPTATVTEETQGTRTYAIAVCIFASLGGMFFGYDQGVTGGVIVMDNFLFDFCVGYEHNTYKDCTSSSRNMPENWTTFTTLYNVVYYIGCIVGAYIGGYIAQRYGRRVTIFNAGCLFTTGTLWVCLTPPKQHALVLMGRFFAGAGVGNSSFSLPIFGAEAAPKELRGILSGSMQAMNTTGMLLSNIVNNLVASSTYGWRITNAVALIPSFIVMIGIFTVPESPRWTYQVKGRGEARTVLKRLRQTEHVDKELDAIGDQLKMESKSVTWSTLWLDSSLLRRTLIAMSLQGLQQATGINPVLLYGGEIFRDVSGNGVLSLLILSIVFWLSTFPGMYWVDRVGRRRLLLIGAIGMAVGHLVSAITFTYGCNGNTTSSNCSVWAGYVMIIFTSIFIFNFAISWGPVCWIYPAEIFPTNVRAKAVTLSTMSNWLAGSAMIAVAKLFSYLNVNGVFYLFGFLSLVCFVFVYLFCPETKGLLLEDIEPLFITFEENANSSQPDYKCTSTPNQLRV